MKVSLLTGLVILVLISLSACTVFAQQDASVAVLKDQITQLEKIAQSADTPATMKASSLKLLAEKRAQLRASLKMQIESLLKYQATYGSRLSANENQRVTDSVRNLEYELQNLAGGSKLDSSSLLQEKGHAAKPARGVPSASGIRTDLSMEPVAPKRSNDSNLRPWRIESEYVTRNPSASSGRTLSNPPIQTSATMNVNLIPVRAAQSTPNALVAAATTPPGPNTIPVYWDSSRSAPPCPPRVTEQTTVTFHLTGINDLLVDFDQNRKLIYRLSTKKYSRSQVPPENPFFAPQSGRRIREVGCPPMTTKNELLVVLADIRRQVQDSESISPNADGGRSISLAETKDAATSTSEVRCVLGLLSENPGNQLFEQSEIKYNPVFRWIKLIEGPHSIDLPVVLEADYNYDFKIEEIWGDKATQGGTVKANCGERELFTLSLGPIISTLPSRTYNHQKEPISPGSSTTQDILSVGNTRNINVLGAALLNYHLPRFSWLPSETGLALSAGPVYTLGGTPEVSALGLFVGTSIHLNRSIFITPGIHIGEFADFPAGFTPGAVIPDQFGDLNPVKRRTAHFAIGLTYKTNSFKTSSENGGAAKNTSAEGASNNQP